MEGAVMEYENRAFDEVPLIEKMALELMKGEDGGDPMGYREFLTRYTDGFARATMQRWWELGDFFWAHYARGW
jgi:hypothetical protein